MLGNQILFSRGFLCEDKNKGFIHVKSPEFPLLMPTTTVRVISIKFCAEWARET